MTAWSAHPDQHPTNTTALTQQDLARIVDRGPAGFVVTNTTGVIEWINSTLVEWLGYEQSQLIGQRTFQQLLSPGGRIYYDTHVRPLIHMQHGASEIALEVVCADNRRLPVLINASLVVDELTGAATIETFVVDATRRRQYEAELLNERQVAERSEAHLQVMYDIVSGLAEAETVDEIVGVVTERAGQSGDHARCAIWLMEPGELAAARVGSIPAGQNVQVEFPDGGPALDQLAAGQLVVITDRHDFADTYPLICLWMADSDVRSAAIAPLILGGRLYGAISYGYKVAHEFDEHDLRAARSLATQTAQGLTRARINEAERRNKRHLERLLELTNVLSTALTLDAVVDAMIDGGQQLLGAAGTAIALLDESGTSVRFVSGAESSDTLGIRLPLDSPSIGCETIRTNRPVVLATRQELEELFPHSPILAYPGSGRVMSMPLRRGETVIGAWVLFNDASGPSDPIDVTMFELFAEQAGQATQRAAVHEAEAAARAQADIRNRISAALNRAVTTADVGRAITVEGRAAFNAAALALLVVDPEDPQSLRLEARSHDQEVLHSTPIDDRLASFMRGSGAPMFTVGRSDFDDVLHAALGPNRSEAVALLPLRVGRRPLGLIAISFDRPDVLSSTTQVALSGLTAEANVALARARRHDADHDVAMTLQRSLLPSVGDIGLHWAVTTSHEPWSELLEVGGDLFDVTPFDDGRLVVVVGDVVGHGLEAAAAMGLLRSAAKMLALVAASPAEVIAGLHAFARVTPGVMLSSACCVEIHPNGAGHYSCAGHPFPVLRHAGGETELLEGGRSALLGMGGETQPMAEFEMDVGTSIFLYTDGLIERKGVEYDVGLERLRQHLGQDGGSPGELRADEIVRAMFGDERREDDVVAVCVTRLAEAPVSQV